MSSKIALKTKLMITGINKKSQAKVFKDSKIEDTILISLEIQNRRGYVPSVEVLNLRTGDKYTTSVNMLDSVLSSFDFIKVEE